MGTYTLVRHTGYTIGENGTFKNAVEERGINPRDTPAIIAAGGLVFMDYKEATDRAEAENYPPGAQGIVPIAKGKFKKVRIGRHRTIETLDLFVPDIGKPIVHPQEKV